MAYYFLFPENDATIYSHPDRSEMNTGKDEILEIVKERGSDDKKFYPSRILIKFKNEEIQDVISNTIGSSILNDDTTKINLQLTAAEPKNLLTTLNLALHAVSQSWDEGTGRYSNLPTSSNGASWVYRNNTTTATEWINGGTPQVTTITYPFSTIKTSSLHDKSLFASGAMWLPDTNANTIKSGSSGLGTTFNSEHVFTFTSSVAGADLHANGHLDTLSQVFINGTHTKIDIKDFHTGDSITGAELALATAFTMSSLPQFTASADGNVVTVTTTETGSAFLDGLELLEGETHYSNYGSTTASMALVTYGLPNFEFKTTGSINSSLITQGGGVWYTDPDFIATEQYVVGDSLDTNFDVKGIVQKWSSSLFAGSDYPEGIVNNGFLIKKPEIIETNTSHSFGELQYFSVDTHTIHPPKLTFKWDDSTFADAATSSLVASNKDLNVTLYQNKEEYNQNDIATFRIHVRPKYPTRMFVTSSNYLGQSYFSTASCYSIRDAHTEQEVIPFDDTFTKISADNESNYFKIYMNGLQPERYYRILFKHKDTFGTTIYDDNYYFKVIR